VTIFLFKGLKNITSGCSKPGIWPFNKLTSGDADIYHAMFISCDPLNLLLELALELSTHV
jgi:hypothetical protein